MTFSVVCTVDKNSANMWRERKQGRATEGTSYMKYSSDISDKPLTIVVRLTNKMADFRGFLSF